MRDGTEHDDMGKVVWLDLEVQHAAAVRDAYVDGRRRVSAATLAA